MRQLKQDMTRVQMLVGDALVQTGGLMAVADGVPLSAPKFQKSLERTMELFEQSTLELRQLCERHMPGLGYYGSRSQLPAVSVTGSVDLLHGWLHIRLNTLLPHCRYQTPAWLSDTIRRLLDDYEQSGGVLPHLEQALLVIDEHSDVEGRHIFDQDNKGWKAVCNAPCPPMLRPVIIMVIRLNSWLPEATPEPVVTPLAAWAAGISASVMAAARARESNRFMMDATSFF